MGKRNLIEEIVTKKQRSNNLDWYKAITSLSELQNNFNNLDRNNSGNSCLSLYLVGIASCIEVGVRSTIQRLIDHGSPYTDRIAEFKQQLQIDIDIARALRDKKISFGDLVAHLLPISSIEHINSHLDKLLGKSLRDSLAEIREFVEPPESLWFKTDESTDLDKIIEEENQIQPPLLVPDVSKLMLNLQHLFYLRHITAHEANFNSVTYNEIELFFESSSIFLNALDEIVEQLLNPNMPRTSFGMSFVAAQEAEIVQNEMKTIFKKIEIILQSLENQDLFIEENMPSTIDAFKSSQEAFLEYLRAECEFASVRVGLISGNSLRCIYAYITQSLCEDRIKRLKEVMDNIRSL